MTRTSGCTLARSCAIGQFDVNPLLHPRPQIAGQAGLEPISDIGDYGLVNIAPMTFQVGVHAGKRAFHKLILGEPIVSTLDERCLDDTRPDR